MQHAPLLVDSSPTGRPASGLSSTPDVMAPAQAGIGADAMESWSAPVPPNLLERYLTVPEVLRFDALEVAITRCDRRDRERTAVASMMQAAEREVAAAVDELADVPAGDVDVVIERAAAAAGRAASLGIVLGRLAPLPVDERVVNAALERAGRAIIHARDSIDAPIPDYVVERRAWSELLNPGLQRLNEPPMVTPADKQATERFVELENLSRKINGTINRWIDDAAGTDVVSALHGAGGVLAALDDAAGKVAAAAVVIDKANSDRRRQRLSWRPAPPATVDFDRVRPRLFRGRV